MRQLLLSLFLSTLALGQAQLVADGQHAIGAGFGTAHEDKLATMSFGANLTVAGRLDVSAASVVLRTSDDPTIQSLNATNVSISLLLLRSKQSGGFFAVGYSRTAGTVKLTSFYSGKSLKTSTNAFALSIGITAGTKGPVQPVPSLSLIYSSTMTENQGGQHTIAAGEFPVMITLSDSWLLVPYAGAALQGRDISYGFGVRTTVRLGSSSPAAT